MNFKKTLQIVLGLMIIVAPVVATTSKQKPTQKTPNKPDPKAKPRWDSA
ncbi:MAG: hypothetical protein LLF94_04660 [Chlamydiales bacterium]|nr:hypothetical protein [Chlamydiales bacterium]